MTKHSLDEALLSETIINVSIEDEIKSAYLGYAMSVIVGRALPDVRDGLKPVQRRILYAMHELGNVAQKPHKKSGRIVGDVLGKYHPHGDAPIYEALVRMAQKFSLRYALVDGHGNFGSVDGDPPAHMRYTEVRLTPIAQTLLKDLDRETVDFSANYDGCEEIPDILPAAFPNLLVNGSTGIAVGMATNIPPHNLEETLNACLAYLDDPELSIEELLEHLPGPDFPTAGIIHGTEGILDAYRTGKGRVVLRARAEVQTKGDREQIVVSEIPYQVNKSRLLESIAELVKEKKLEGISELRDESDRNGIRVVIELKRGVVGEVILNHLYQQTALQTPFSVNMVVVSEGRPVRMNLKEMIAAFIRHRRMVVLRRTRHDHEQLKARLHILDGLMTALYFLDHCIQLIKNSDSPAQAKTALMETDWNQLSLERSHMNQAASVEEVIDFASFKMTAEQASAILELRLHRLTGLEVNKLLQEAAQARMELVRLNEILNNPLKLTEVIRTELRSLKSYADGRKTEIQASFSLADEDFIANETVVVTFSQKGYIKYQPLSEYGAQRRGGRGKAAATLRTEDFGEGCLVVNTHDRLLCFSSKGRVYWLKVYQLPRAGRSAKGRPIVNLLPLVGEERITTILPVEKGKVIQEQYVVLATALGTLKKIQLSDLQTVRSSGVIACKLQPGDTLVGAEITHGQDDILLFSAQGKVVRFPESQLRAMGRNASGVRGIQLDSSDCVVSLCVPKTTGSILTVTKNGYGKRTAVKEYPSKSRATKGVISIKVNERNGPVIGALQVDESDEIILLTQQGILLRLRVQEVSNIGRNTQGVTLVRLEEGDQVVGVQKFLDADSVEKFTQKDLSFEVKKRDESLNE